MFLYFGNVYKIASCYRDYLAERWEGIAEYMGCVDALPIYADKFECLLGWAESEVLAAYAYAACLNV
ncbi:MAG: hypothetical protein FJW21_05290 [Acidimicrobiia bacterium]|nr:hypothetical protein [Acidimicrobiia bacterium]